MTHSVLEYQHGTDWRKVEDRSEPPEPSPRTCGECYHYDECPGDCGWGVCMEKSMFDDLSWVRATDTDDDYECKKWVK